MDQIEIYQVSNYKTLIYRVKQVICHLFLMNTLSDTQSIPVLLSFLFEKVNQVVTFKRMNMASATISNASTNTTRPRNISFTRI